MILIKENYIWKRWFLGIGIEDFVIGKIYILGFLSFINKIK